MILEPDGSLNAMDTFNDRLTETFHATAVHWEGGYVVAGYNSS